MGMIACDDCKEMISTSARICPKCGCQVSRTSMLVKILLAILIIGFLGSFLSSPAKAADKRERIRVYGVWGADRFVTGDTVPASKIYGRLYLDKKCDLPVSDAKNMRALFWTNQRVYRTGCWFATLDNGFVMLYSNGETEKQPSWKMLPMAKLNQDGSAEIFELDFDSETIVRKVMEAQTAEMLERMRRGEY